MVRMRVIAREREIEIEVEIKRQTGRQAGRREQERKKGQSTHIWHDNSPFAT